MARDTFRYLIENLKKFRVFQGGLNRIKISNLENKKIWEKQLTEEEFSIIKSHIRGSKAIAIFPATRDIFKC